MGSCPLNLACIKAYENKPVMDKSGSFQTGFYTEARKDF